MYDTQVCIIFYKPKPDKLEKTNFNTQLAPIFIEYQK